jgi:PhnB protein
MAKPIPEGYSGPMAYLTVHDAGAAIDFYTRAFGARERARMSGPGGTVAHAELELGGGVLMLSDPFPQATTKPPTEVGGTTATVMMYVEDVDAAVQKAVDAGAEITMPVDDQFWGDRFGSIRDPFGHSWALATHVEDVPPEEMAQRAEQAMAAMAG